MLFKQKKKKKKKYALIFDFSKTCLKILTLLANKYNMLYLFPELI